MGNPESKTDLQLLHAARNGDQKSFHELIDRHAGKLFGIAMSLTRNRADAEDVLQEALVGAFRGMHRFAEKASVKTWLMQIVTRQAHKSWKRSRHHRKNRSMNAIDADTIADRNRSAETSEAKNNVLEILHSLPAVHREILILRQVQELSYDQIAKALKVPRGTVESRLYRARLELRRRMESRKS
jgi:RNA polymerase sigma-70 factor (ECF subfamily)